MYRHVDVRSLAIKNLKVSECILKSTRCPAGSQYRPIKTDPFPKQGTELKKKAGLFPRSNTYHIASTNIWIDNHVSISSARIPFCHAQISGRSLCWPNRKRDLGKRDWSYSLLQEKVSYTALALWECVKQLKHFENKKNVLTTLWQLSANFQMFKWWYDLSDTSKAAVIGGPFWRWIYDNMLWQILNSLTFSQ